MTRYDYRVLRQSDGRELASGEIEDILEAGPESMTYTIAAGILHSHPDAQGLQFHDLDIRMDPRSG